MFCAPGLVFGYNEGVGSHFLVLRSRTHFRRYRRYRVPFSCSGLISDGTEGVEFGYHILRFRTRFRRYRGRRDPFSCLVRPNSFRTILRASGSIVMFCAPEIIFGGTEDVGSHFHISRARTRFQRYRGRRVPFSSFARPNSFPTVTTASCLFFIFRAPGLVFSGTEGVEFRFHVLCARNSFRWYRGRRFPFSYFALPDSFSAVARASGPV
jgi:hypothetical protein